MGLLVDMCIEKIQKRQGPDDHFTVFRRDPHIRDIWAYAEATASAGLCPE